MMIQQEVQHSVFLGTPEPNIKCLWMELKNKILM